MKTSFRRRRRSAFTLIEVLLVLAILVILGALVVPNIIRTQQSGYSDVAKSQVESFKQLMMRYRLDVGSYPSASQGLQALRTPPPDLKNPVKWRGPYTDGEVPLDPWDNPYNYELLGADAFRISSSGPDLTAGTEDDIVAMSGV